MSEPKHPSPPMPQEWLEQLKRAQALPAEIPDSWLQRITQANRTHLQLPEIPESWLHKIKEATKPDLLSAILGSSILAALIAMGSAALTARMTNTGAERLEKFKLQLQAESDQVKKGVQAYIALARDLDSLASALDAYLRMSEIASKVQGDAVSAADLLAQRNKVGLAEKEVLAAEKDIASYNAGLPTEIEACLGHLSLALSATEGNPKAAASLKPVLDQLKQLVSRVNQDMNKSFSKTY